MPYKDPEKQRAFQKERAKRRREEFMLDKYCDCGIKAEFIHGTKVSFSSSLKLIESKTKLSKFMCEKCFKTALSNRVSKQRTIHGHSKGNESASGRTPTYITWHGMIERCRDKNRSNYKYYGGKGIKVCERWHSFENFIKDMGERPDGMQIDRIDPEKDYCPENCRWLDKSENVRRAVSGPRK